jgi:F-type H+-transporting ATPase subunit a
MVPSTLQNIFEFIVESLDNLTESIAGDKGRGFLHIVGTFFLFILFSNWMGLLPGFGSIGFWEESGHKMVLVPLFRGPTADLNTTIALGFLSFILIQYYGFKFLHVNYFKKFINLKGPIDFFVGILEIISDISKIISFAFRLFGNIFAGEVLLSVISFLTYGLAVLPFLGLEVFVGFVQALVFAMLTLVFMNISTQQHGE